MLIKKEAPNSYDDLEGIDIPSNWHFETRFNKILNQTFKHSIMSFKFSTTIFKQVYLKWIPKFLIIDLGVYYINGPKSDPKMANGRTKSDSPNNSMILLKALAMDPVWLLIMEPTVTFESLWFNGLCSRFSLARRRINFPFVDPWRTLCDLGNIAKGVCRVVEVVVSSPNESISSLVPLCFVSPPTL